MKNNILRIVKMVAFFSVLGLFLQATLLNILLIASPVEAQNLNSVKVSMNVTDVTLEEAMQIIEQKTDFSFSYFGENLPLSDKVTVDVTQESLYNILYAFAKDYGLVFQRINKQITVRKADTNNREIPDVVDATGRITGKVVDAKTTESLIGANIILKGTTFGAATDLNGEYKIENITPGEYTIVVKYVGYKQQEETVIVVANRTVELNFSLEQSSVGLDEVIVTANLVEMKRKAISSAVTTFNSAELEKMPVKQVKDLFRGEIPGGSAFDQGSIANYYTSANLRGTNSLSFNSIKTYVDGIEVAHPNFTATLDFNNIEKIELLRGPQASTLYGSDASGGVLNIFTKKGSEGPPQVNLKISAGTIKSKYIDKTSIQQDYSVSVKGGVSGFTYNLGGSFNKQDPYLPPEGYVNQTNVSGGVKTQRGLFTLELSGQYSKRKWGSGLFPALKIYPYFAFSTYSVNSLEQQNLGFTIKYTPTSKWQHILTIGWNRIATQNYGTRATPNKPLVGNSYGSVNKTSYRYYSTVKFPIVKSLSSTITAGIDHYTYNSASFNSPKSPPNGRQFSADQVSISTANYSNTGYYGQFMLNVADNLFITTGIRFEDNDNFGKDYGLASAPRIGASYAIDLGSLSLKPRVSYGKGIKPPASFQQIASVNDFIKVISNPDLGPEQQIGMDGGIDIFIGDDLASFEATYYNQTAKDLIDFVLVDPSTSPLVYQYQNVGEIKNRGLELAGTLNLDPFSFRFTYTYTKSTIEKLAPKYTGALKPGDDLLEIPKFNGGATITYSFPAFTAGSSGGNISLNLSYFGEWTGTDVLGLYGFYFGGDPYRGSQRAYWKTYPGFVKANLGLDYNITPNLDLFLNIKNLFDKQDGERFNITITPGRITMLGVRLNFNAPQ